MSKYRSNISSYPLGTDVIQSEIQALDLIANGGRVIFLGDTHNSSEGHKAVADLMPTLARAHVTALALELPPSMNGLIKELQDDIGQKNLDPESVASKFKENMEAADHSLNNGDQAYRDAAEIIIAATKQKIKVVGIDGRQDNAAFIEKVSALQNKYRATPNDMDFLFSMDGENAQRAKKLLVEQGDQNRIAIMHGTGHGCEKEGQLRLVDYLKQDGVSVTVISLDPTQHLKINGLCEHPPAISVDAGNLDKDISGRQSNRAATTASVHAAGSHVKSSAISP